MWRKPTVADLEATLDSGEAEAFAASDNITEGVIDKLLARTAGLVRTYLRHNSSLASKMGPEGTIPEEVISPAMDYLAVDVLKRIDIQPNEIRAQARRDAMDYFKQVSECSISPEPYGGSVEASNVTGSPATAPAHPKRLLD